MFSIIVACDKYSGIGSKGSIPWSSPEDMKYFKNKTNNAVVIMGRNTYNSIVKKLGKPLPNRTTLLISTQLTQCDIAFDNVLVFDKIEKAVVWCCDKQNLPLTHNNVYVCGGESIYNWFIDNKLISYEYITKFEFNHACDKYYKEIKQQKNCIRTHQITDGIICENVVVNAEENAMLNIMNELFFRANEKSSRAGPVYSLFGRQLKFDLTNNKFPLMTTRRMFLRGIFEELMLYIRGQTDSQILEKKGIPVWTGNTSREFLDKHGLQWLSVGDMGHSYGHSFRHFGAQYNGKETDYTGEGFDQLEYVIKTLKNNPDSRRMIISLWEPNHMRNTALPPCLYQYQFYVADKKLSCMMTQRSSDFAVAGGWNVATGALLTIMLAHVTRLSPGELTWNIGDVHLYHNHLSGVSTQINREPRIYPSLYLRDPPDNIEDFSYENLQLVNYLPYKKIKYEMNV